MKIIFDYIKKYLTYERMYIDVIDDENVLFSHIIKEPQYLNNSRNGSIYFHELYFFDFNLLGNIKKNLKISIKFRSK